MEHHPQNMNKIDCDFIQSALNVYWNNAHQQLQRNDLGDIERLNYECQLSNSKRLLTQFEQAGNDSNVICKQPTDEEIILIISEIANHYQSGLAYSLHTQYYVNKVRNLFSSTPKPAY